MKQTTTQRTQDEIVKAEIELWEHIGRFCGAMDLDLTTYGPGIGAKSDALVLANETKATVMERAQMYLCGGSDSPADAHAAFFRAYKKTTGANIGR